ncbi:MAG: hypothetical protein P8X70_01055 [Nanoarchaeota archaeon]
MGESSLLFGIAVEIWALLISFIAIFIALLKDFILPWFFKPKLIFKYSDLNPYRRENVVINRNSQLKGTFLRFMVKNIGTKPAINCRCQIQSVWKNGQKYEDYQGFPLRWASRPESIINQASGERLNIARGESEFIDMAVATNNNHFIHLQKYHNVDIGIKEIIEAGRYNIILIFSGDNFKPCKLQFHIERKNTNDPNDISLQLVRFWN